MFEFKIDLVDFERKTKQLGAAIDQIPFALSLALNDAVKVTRQKLVKETWPQHVTQRNVGFIGRALRTEFATKHNLRVEIYDDLNRASLKLHETGGTKVGRRRLAIPPSTTKRGAHGIAKSQRPAAIIASTPKRALRITPRGIFIGVSGRLRLMFGLTRTASQPADVPFQQDFREAMLNEVRMSFPSKMAKAMRSP